MNKHLILAVSVGVISFFMIGEFSASASTTAHHYNSTPLINLKFESKTVPYYIKTKNKRLIKGFKQSAKNWNATKAVKFKQINKFPENGAYIVEKSVYKRFKPGSKAEADGQAFLGISNTLAVYNPNDFTLMHTDANFNEYYMSKRYRTDLVADYKKLGYSKKKATALAKSEVKHNSGDKMIAQVLTHENGHDLGLADVHNHQKLLMHYMSNKLQASKPTKVDIRGVKKRFKTKLNPSKAFASNLDSSKFNDGVMHVSWLKTYTTLAQVKANTSNIVKVKVINNHMIKSKITGKDTIDKVRVSQVIKGSKSLKYRDISIHQMGTTNHALEGSEILTPGDMYVLALIKEPGFKDQYEPLQEGVSIFEAQKKSDNLVRVYDNKAYTISDLKQNV